MYFCKTYIAIVTDFDLNDNCFSNGALQKIFGILVFIFQIINK